MKLEAATVLVDEERLVLHPEESDEFNVFLRFKGAVCQRIHWL